MKYDTGYGPKSGPILTRQRKPYMNPQLIRIYHPKSFHSNTRPFRLPTPFYNVNLKSGEKGKGKR